MTMGRRTRTTRKGLAALETALLLPVLAAMLYLLVEGGNAVMTYSALAEASRVAARQVLMTGDAADAADLVPSLLPDLDPGSLSSTVSFEDAGNTVTVEISYAYPSLFGASPLGSPHESLLSLAARTSMPMP